MTKWRWSIRRRTTREKWLSRTRPPSQSIAPLIPRLTLSYVDLPLALSPGVILCQGTCSGSQGISRFGRRTPVGPPRPYLPAWAEIPSRAHVHPIVRRGLTVGTPPRGILATGAPSETSTPCFEISHDSFYLNLSRSGAKSISSGWQK